MTEIEMSQHRIFIAFAAMRGVHIRAGLHTISIIIDYCMYVYVRDTRYAASNSNLYSRVDGISLSA